MSLNKDRKDEFSAVRKVWGQPLPYMKLFSHELDYVTAEGMKQYAEEKIFRAKAREKFLLSVIAKCCTED